MTDVHTKEVRSYNMSKVRGKDTNPELIVRKYLFSRGLRYRINDKRYPGHPDIVLPKYQTVVFINGCFWHMHKECSKAALPKSNSDFWKAKILKNKERDTENIRLLEDNGWKVITVWECELKNPVREHRLEQLYLDITTLDKSVIDN